MPKTIDCLTTFVLPRTEFKAIEEIGLISAKISIAPLIIATLFEISPTSAKTVEISIIT